MDSGSPPSGVMIPWKERRLSRRNPSMDILQNSVGKPSTSISKIHLLE
jgi:hypothetical protein